VEVGDSLESDPLLALVLLVVVVELENAVKCLDREDVAALEGDEACVGVVHKGVAECRLEDDVHHLVELRWRSAHGAHLISTLLTTDGAAQVAAREAAAARLVAWKTVTGL